MTERLNVQCFNNVHPWLSVTMTKALAKNSPLPMVVPEEIEKLLR